jgi:hypothetical protein
MGTMNPMIFLLATVFGEKGGESSRKAVPIALLGSMMRPPMIGLVLALAVARGGQPSPGRPRHAHRPVGALN